MAIGQIVGQQPAQSRVGPVATGQAYAQQIAGGMPFEQVVAPGLQFSPEAPMGLTQAQLDLISAGEAPVMPVAPTIGEPVAPSIPTMPFAPIGTPMPTLPFIQRKFDMTEIGEPFEPDFDFFLRDIEERELADILEDIEVPSLFDINIPEVPAMPAQPASVEFEFGVGRDFPAPEGSEGPAFVVNPDGTSLMMPPPPQSGGVQQPSTTVGQTIGDIRDTYTAEQVAELQRRERERQAQEEANIIAKYGSRENLQNQIDAALGTNLVMPIDLEPRIPVKQPPPVIPNIPVFTPPPVPSLFAEPRVNIDDIVSPISAGRITRRMPNLFNLV